MSTRSSGRYSHRYPAAAGSVAQVVVFAAKQRAPMFSQMWGKASERFEHRRRIAMFAPTAVRFQAPGLRRSAAVPEARTSVRSVPVVRPGATRARRAATADRRVHRRAPTDGSANRRRIVGIQSASTRRRRRSAPGFTVRRCNCGVERSAPSLRRDRDSGDATGPEIGSAAAQ